MAKQRGQLVVIDGSDRSGKKTTTLEVRRQLESQSKRVACLDFPQYQENFFGKLCFDFQQGLFGHPIETNSYLAVLPYIFDAWESKETLEDWLELFDFVLLDRYPPVTNLLYQGVKLKTEVERRAYAQWLDKACYRVLKLPRPDFVIFLETPARLSQRLERGEKDENEKNVAYQEAIQNLIPIVAKNNHWHIVQAASETDFRPKEKIAQDIISIIMPKP